MANYDYFMELERERRGQEPQLPAYLQDRPAPPPAPWTPSESGFYRGAPGTPEEFSFTNIPDVAQRGGLRGYSLSEAQAILPDGSEYYGEPLGEREWRNVETATRPTPSPPVATRTTDDYASKMEMGRKIIDKAMAKGIPIAEIKQYLQMKGYDMEPSKPMEVEAGRTVIDPRTGRVIYKAEPKVEKASIPRFGVSVEAAARAMGYESFADVPTGEEANKVMEEARRQQSLGVSAKEEAKAGFRQPSATERTALSDIETSIAMLDSLGKMYKPEYTGPIAGRAGGVQSVTGIGLSPGEASFRAATSTFRNQVIKAVTGAQMSEPEAQRIRKQIPEENDPPEVWRAKRQEATRLLQETLATKKDILARGGYILGEARGETRPDAAATGGGAGGSKFDKFMK